jgi:hypothetical protein
MLAQTIRIFALFALVTCGRAADTDTGEPWTDKQLKEPAALAAAIKDPKAVKPVIFNIGPVNQIKGAIQIGAVSDDANLDLLRKKLAALPKDKEVVIYCGCCPFQRCPNVRPAFELLKELKFTNAKLLNLPNNLKTDWISKGYPVE